VLVVGCERSADGPARIARSRLNPDSLERPIAQNLAIRNGIERDAARKA